MEKRPLRGSFFYADFTWACCAEQVIAEDNTVDGCFTRFKSQLIQRIASGEGDGEATLDLLMIAKYYERIGDHATNIAEWVEFSVTGVHKTEVT